MSENTESIHIHELDEDGTRLAAAEIEAELADSASANPWLIALWAFNGLLVLLAVLSFIGLSQGSSFGYVDYENGGSQLQTTQPTWLSLLGPYAIGFVIFAVLGTLSTLITHAMIWERRRRG